METEIDLSRIPVSALQLRTKEELSSRLNGEKVLFSPDKIYQRDFRGLADCMNLKPMWAPENDHVKKLLYLWATDYPGEAYLGKLCEFLERIDRFDVLEDIRDSFEEDARVYLNRNLQLTPWQPTQIESISAGDDFVSICDQDMFDAFVLYVDADHEFAQMILNSMQAAQLRVCDRNRSLLPGENELRAVYRLIEHQCRTLVVVFSNESLRDESCMNAFYFAWNLSNNSAASLERVIPCVYKDCTLPKDILSLVRLDFTRYDRREFLYRLRWSIARTTDASCIDTRSSPNAISSRDCQLESSVEIRSITDGESEHSITDSELNELNRAPLEPTPLAKRIRSVISRFTPKRQRRSARPVVSDTV